MKAFVFCIVFAASSLFALAQDEGGCYDGRLENGVGNITEVPCDFANGGVCQTKIEVNQNDTYVDLQCQQDKACTSNQNNNGQNCYSIEAQEKEVQVCFFCCSTSLCNIAIDEIPPSP
ncbi:uncharacterized protein LOC143463431 [Clavelina lepadiformis]|uniref:Uncharacterized protein n=1 Tax=Clavelina lepadiformis TaxID=159417 RepID=A0ABP0GLV5_CLALP